MSTMLLNRLTPDQRDIIEKIQTEIPVRIGYLSKLLGISSIKVTQLPIGISGQISKEEQGYVIRINKNESRERQRFTIAHEISHYLLHKDLIDLSPNGISDSVLYRSGASRQVEFEANKLASYLILPRDRLRQIVDLEYSGETFEVMLEKLAGRFEVSKAAMEIGLNSIYEF
jgi:Zn-dependent peptidase ImmA (M78 family)